MNNLWAAACMLPNTVPFPGSFCIGITRNLRDGTVAVQLSDNTHVTAHARMLEYVHKPGSWVTQVSVMRAQFEKTKAGASSRQWVWKSTLT